MPDVFLPGPAGRLEGRYAPAQDQGAPLAVILHPHPQHGGTMNNKVVYALFSAFVARGFAVLRFNFRGVGRSQGAYDRGEGELADATTALDWIQTKNPNAQGVWVAGFSFGAWIAMQLLMRRPEIESFIAVAPPANMLDFSFLAPCPTAGLIVHGEADEIAPEPHTARLAAKLMAQRSSGIDYRVVPEANHFFTRHLDVLTHHVGDYLDSVLYDRTSGSFALAG